MNLTPEQREAVTCPFCARAYLAQPLPVQIPREPTDKQRMIATYRAEAFTARSQRCVTAQDVLDAYYAILGAAQQQNEVHMNIASSDPSSASADSEAKDIDRACSNASARLEVLNARRATAMRDEYSRGYREGFKAGQFAAPAERPPTEAPCAAHGPAADRHARCTCPIAPKCPNCGEQQVYRKSADGLPFKACKACGEEWEDHETFAARERQHAAPLRDGLEPARDALVEEIAAALEASAAKYRAGGHMRQFDLENRAASAIRSLAEALAQRDKALQTAEKKAALWEADARTAQANWHAACDELAQRSDAQRDDDARDAAKLRAERDAYSWCIDRAEAYFDPDAFAITGMPGRYQTFRDAVNSAIRVIGATPPASKRDGEQTAERKA